MTEIELTDETWKAVNEMGCDRTSLYCLIIPDDRWRPLASQGDIAVVSRGAQIFAGNHVVVASKEKPDDFFIERTVLDMIPGWDRLHPDSEVGPVLCLEARGEPGMVRQFDALRLARVDRVVAWQAAAG